MSDHTIHDNTVVAARASLAAPVAFGHVVDNLILAHVEVKLVEIVDQDIRLEPGE